VNVNLAYLGHSDVIRRGGGQVLQLVPNLSRDPVAFDAPLLQPLRFREAISALHDTVISDLRFKKKDKAAYLTWRKAQSEQLATLRRTTAREATQAVLHKRADVENNPAFVDLRKDYERARRIYWDARHRYSRYLLQHDRELWRMLMPCDPVITVADDVVFFECFSADESSYGCLTVERDGGFGPSAELKFGTTNVDYSWNLYHHFQTLRTYRQTRFNIDPAGFAVATESRPDYREEKIDLPDGWLRGFLQIQSAMTMPTFTVSLSREAVYSILAFLRRHKAHKSPRAMRFELLPGEPPRVVLEPWEKAIVSYGTRYDGPSIEPVRVWGVRRLVVLARTLPLADSFTVHLLGTGLPSFWVARMGEMRLTLGLSGWTTNDWTRGSAVDLFAPPAAPAPDTIENVAAVVRERQRVTLAKLQQQLGIDAANAAAALRELAHAGQIIHDLTANVYRWRQVMPKALGQAEIGPEHPEMIEARRIMQRNRVTIESRHDAPNMPGGYILTGKVDGVETEMIVDGDNRIRRGKCPCMYYRRFALKNGPCRHMIALRWSASVGALDAYSASSWYGKMLGRR
jgi:hypothetical protein